MKNFSRIVVSTKPHSETGFPPSPNFDDEATLLTARPVVPIKRAFDPGSVRSYLVKGIIIVAAAIAGAAVAVSADYFKNHRHSEAAIAVAPSAPTSDEAVSEISQTPATAPQSSAAINPNTMAPAETDLNAPASIYAKETKQATNNQVQKKFYGNERGIERTKVVEKRSEPSAQQRHIAKVHSSVDSTQNARRQRDAGSIREIFEGPSPF